MQGLVDNEENVANGSPIDFNKIAVRYRDWITSPPFDIGMTTKNGLTCLQRNLSANKAR
jgi:hypothetical protein